MSESPRKFVYYMDPNNINMLDVCKLAAETDRLLRALPDAKIFIVDIAKKKDYYGDTAKTYPLPT